MKFFKRRGGAFLAAAVMVIASTLLSVNIKLGGKSQDVIDGFYDGVYYNGYTQKSLASHLRNISAYADGIITIANNYDIDTEDAKWASDDLKNSLRYSYGYAGHIYYCYDELISLVAELEDKLGRVELSERDQEGLADYSSSIDGAQSAIETCGYNESVREFLRDYMRFPAENLADLAGTQLPEYFS